VFVFVFIFPLVLAFVPAFVFVVMLKIVHAYLFMLSGELAFIVHISLFVLITLFVVTFEILFVNLLGLHMLVHLKDVCSYY